MVNEITLACYPSADLSKQPELKETLKQMALDRGYKLKLQSNGEMELNQYVYDLMQDMLVIHEQQKEHLQIMHNIPCDTLLYFIHSVLTHGSEHKAYDDLLQIKNYALKVKEAINNKDGLCRLTNTEYNMGDHVKFLTYLNDCLLVKGKIIGKQKHGRHGFLYSVMALPSLVTYNDIFSHELIKCDEEELIKE